jgi:peroxiredoxin (alkyl hydroperoxide reductase subunit C)
MPLNDKETPMSEIVKVGEVVPDFEMDTFDAGEQGFGKVSLADLKSKKKWTVLVFYPADYTFVCPTELADVAEKYADIVKAGGEVISVSTDTKFVHMAWQREEGLLKGIKYKMAADPTGRVSRLFGVYDEASGLALRGTFIISPDGKLVSSEVNFYNVGRNAAELLRKVQANSYLSTHPQEACPANWSTGGKTLKTGGNEASLVGRVAQALK